MGNEEKVERSTVITGTCGSGGRRKSRREEQVECLTKKEEWKQQNRMKPKVTSQGIQQRSFYPKSAGSVQSSESYSSLTTWLIVSNSHRLTPLGS